jgi:hypothetical protein
MVIIVCQKTSGISKLKQQSPPERDVSRAGQFKILSRKRYLVLEQQED